MNRDLINHLNSEQRKRDEIKKRKQENFEMSMRQNNNNTSFNNVPDMKSAYKKVQEKSDITHNEDYLRVTGNLKYDV
jgi:hypothetical protein|tara:strand:- start:204 stop:434 length:231 start_codon:yes stop_codon:yes gene_type:complete